MKLKKFLLIIFPLMLVLLIGCQKKGKLPPPLQPSAQLYSSGEILLTAEVTEIKENFDEIKNILETINPSKKFNQEEMQNEFYNRELNFNARILSVESDDPLAQKLKEGDVFEISPGGINNYFFAINTVESENAGEKLGEKLPQKVESIYYTFNKNKFASSPILDMEVETIFSITVKLKSTDPGFEEFRIETGDDEILDSIIIK